MPISSNTKVLKRIKYLAVFAMAIAAAFSVFISKQPVLGEVYFENTVPPEWFEDYSEHRIKQLLAEFQQSGAISKWLESNSKIQKSDSSLLSITAYMDDEEGYDKQIWIIRLSLPNKWGLTQTQEILKSLGDSLGVLIKKSKPKTGE